MDIPGVGKRATAARTVMGYHDPRRGRTSMSGSGQSLSAAHNARGKIKAARRQHGQRPRLPRQPFI